MIERVRRGFLFSFERVVQFQLQSQTTLYFKKKKKKGELSPDRCRLSLETNEPCELPKLVTVHRTRRSDRSPYESLLFLHGTVLDVKQTVEMAGSRFSQLDCTIRSEFQNYDCAS